MTSATVEERLRALLSAVAPDRIGGSASVLMEHAISGCVQGKRFIFLLILSRQNSYPGWVQMLQDEGYGGSVVVSTVSFFAAEEALRSGMVDAVLMWDADTFRKDYKIEDILRRMEAAGIARPPFYRFGDPIHLKWAAIPLHDFLAAHCQRV